MSSSNKGLNAIYNGGLTAGYTPVVQGGAGFMDWMKKANDFAKKYQIISKIGAVSDAIGARDLINQKTGGYFDKAIDMGQKRGYGKKKKGRGKAKPKKRGRGTVVGGIKRQVMPIGWNL